MHIQYSADKKNLQNTLTVLLNLASSLMELVFTNTVYVNLRFK